MTRKQREQLVKELREAIEEIMHTPGGFQYWSDLMSRAAAMIEQDLKPK